MTVEFGMNFGYDNGSALTWFGSSDLGPMYTAYSAQAAYCVAHGFKWANTHFVSSAGITTEVLANVLGILAGAGLKIILWLLPFTEAGWDINSRELNPIYALHENVIQFLDTRLDLAQAIEYIGYAVEIHERGTFEEIESFLAWAYPLYRQWLSDTQHLQHVKLVAGMGSSRLVAHGDLARMIAKYTDIFGISEYPLTDAAIQSELDTWEGYGLQGTPILMQEMNNSARMHSEIGYAAENYFGYVPYNWLAQWENHGTQIIILHMGNNSYNAYAQWFGEFGEPLAWLTDDLVAHIASPARWHGYMRISGMPVGDWTANQIILMKSAIRRMGGQLGDEPVYRTHTRVIANDNIIVEGDFDLTECTAEHVSRVVEGALELDFGSLDLDLEIFGGLDSDWLTSGAACRAYLAA